MLMELVMCVAFLSQGQVTSGPQGMRSGAHSEVHHDKEFWRAIVKNNFTPPAGSSTAELAFELSKLLGSPDPELRDDLATTILGQWIYETHQIDTATLRKLTAEWLENLAAVSDPGNDSVLRRSFSALMLSIAIARDNKEPFLDQHDFRKIWDSSLTYLARETDLRGFDNRLGWIHSAAHTADLLKFLARSRYLGKQDQAALLSAVQQKLTTVPVVFTYGEDERYARTVLSVLLRNDFDVENFSRWAKDLRPALPPNSVLNEQMLHAQQNVKNFLVKLDFLLSLQGEQGQNVRSAEEAVRAAAKGTF